MTALQTLIELIEVNNYEFSDACDNVLRQFSLDQDDLTAQYDRHCERNGQY